MVSFFGIGGHGGIGSCVVIRFGGSGGTGRASLDLCGSAPTTATVARQHPLLRISLTASTAALVGDMGFGGFKLSTIASAVALHSAVAAAPEIGRISPLHAIAVCQCLYWQV